MKRNLLVALLSLSASSIFAMSVVNIDNAKYTCNGIRISSKTTITTLQNNCKDAQVIIHDEPHAAGAVRIPGGGAEMTMIAPVDPNDETQMDKVEFYTDRGSYMKCYYRNNTFVKCKRTPPSNSSTTNSSVSTVTAKVSSSSAI